MELSIKTYNNREELLNAIHSTALQHGYITVIRKFKGEKYVIIGCDRECVYRPTEFPIEQRKKKSASPVQRK